MAKLWISNKLELRWNEWPELPGNPDITWIDQAIIDKHNAALAKAKEESILVVDQDGFACVNNGGKPDSFADFPIEVEAVDQYMLWNGEWRDITDETILSEGSQTRQVARLKPVNSAHGFTEGAEFSSDITKVFPVTKRTSDEIVGSALSRKIEELDAANARINELEQWKKEELFVFGPILDYCQDESNAKRLGIGLGQSISARILEILKAYK